jgi:hypothetical protein
MKETVRIMESDNRKGSTMTGRWCRIAFVALSVMAFSHSAGAATVYVSYVTENNAQVRAAPAATAQAIYSPPQLTVLEVVDHESQADWFQVITPGGDRGWILKTTVTFQEDGAADASIASKGVVDREYARTELLKWWQTTGRNATPVCDICNARVPANTGYMLTARQVLSSRAYHDLLKRTRPSIERYKQTVATFEKDRTPWCICETCIDTYFMHMPGSSNPGELAVAQQANEDLRKRTLEAVRKQYTIEQVREKMQSGQVWFIEDPGQSNTIIPIIPKVDGWILEALEKQQ